MTAGFRFRDLKLPFKMLLLYVLLGVIPFMIGGIFIFILEYQQVEDNAHNSVQLMGTLKANEIGQVLHEISDVVEEFATDEQALPVYRRAFTATPLPGNEAILAADEQLELLWTELNSVEQLFLISVENNRVQVVSDYGGTETDLLQDTIDLLEARPAHTVYSSIYEGVSGSPYLDVITPVPDTRGQPMGYLVLTQDLSRAGTDELPDFYHIIQTLPEVRELSEFHLVILDEKGTLLATSTRNNVLFESFETHPYLTEDRHYLTEEYNSIFLNESVFGYTAPIAETDWVLIIEVPENAARAVQFEVNLPVTAFILGLMLSLVGLLLLLLYNQVGPPALRLTDAVRRFNPGDKNPILTTIQRRDEIGILHNACVNLGLEYQADVQQLASKAELFSQSHKLIDDIFQVIRRIHDTDYFLEEAMRLIRDQIATVEYAAIYLLENNNQMAVLHAATGEVGRRLLVQSYRQDMSMQSSVAQAVKIGQTVLVRLEEQNKDSIPQGLEVYKSELAIPLRLENRITGVLNLYSHEENGFSTDLSGLLESHARILALIIAMQELQRIFEVSQLTDPSTTSLRHSWHNYLQSRQRAELAAMAGQAPELHQANWSELQIQAMETLSTAVEDDGKQVRFAIPVIINERPVGAVEWEIEAWRYNDDLQQTAYEIVQRLALAADNARLFEQSQRLVERERVVNEISQQLSLHTDIRQILQVAVKELGQALGAPDTRITFKATGSE